MSPALPNPPARRVLPLCLLAVLALHGLVLREAPTWWARPAAAATTVASSASAHSVTTRLLQPVADVELVAAQDPPRPAAPTVPKAAPRVAAKASSPDAPKPASDGASIPAGASATSATSAASAAAPASGPALAPVQAPAPIRLDYRLQRGAIAGEARLDWQHDGRRYALDLDGQLPLVGTLMHQRSEGGFDASGLAPLRYTERRLRRSERAVNFNRPADGQPGHITFSASTADLPLRAGAQDRLSWMVQLAARLAGLQALPAAGSRIEMDVASAGGDVQDWHFVLQGRSDDGTWHWRRDTGEPDATQAEVWTDPAHAHWPRRVRLTERAGEPVELVLKDR